RKVPHAEREAYYENTTARGILPSPPLTPERPRVRSREARIADRLADGHRAADLLLHDVGLHGAGGRRDLVDPHLRHQLAHGVGLQDAALLLHHLAPPALAHLALLLRDQLAHLA